MLRTVRILINFFVYPHNPSNNLMYSLGCYMNTAVTDLDALYRPCKEKNHTLTHVTPRNFLGGPVRRRALCHASRTLLGSCVPFTKHLVVHTRIISTYGDAFRVPECCP